MTGNTVTTLSLCSLCRRPINPVASSTLQRITGWERRGFATSRRGGSDIVLREHLSEYAHSHCIERQRLGLPSAQMSLGHVTGDRPDDGTDAA